MKENDQMERILAVIKDITETVTSKNNQYMESPIETLPMISWLHQIRIKSERAIQARFRGKRNEELKDCTVYCILALAKDRKDKNLHEIADEILEGGDIVKPLLDDSVEYMHIRGG